MSLPTISKEQYIKINKLDGKEELILPRYESDKLSNFLKAYFNEKSIEHSIDIPLNLKSTIRVK